MKTANSQIIIEQEIPIPERYANATPNINEHLAQMKVGESIPVPSTSNKQLVSIRHKIQVWKRNMNSKNRFITQPAAVKDDVPKGSVLVQCNWAENTGGN